MLRGIVVVVALFVCLCASSCGGGSSAGTSQVDGQQVLSGQAPKAGVLEGKTPSWDESGAEDFLVWDMVFGQHYPYGTAEIVLQGGAYFMKFTLTPAAAADDWRYTEAHVNIWTGTPPAKADVPGKYPYKWSVANWAAGQTEVLLPLGSWAPAADFSIAIHAVIKQPVYDELGNIVGYNNETGWGGLWWATKAGKDEGAHWTTNWDKKWGGFMTKADTLANKLPLFDPFPMTFHAQYTAALGSYWQLEFTTSVPGAFGFVWDYLGAYTRGWCCDPQYLGSGGTDSATIYSSYDANLPAYAKDPDWDLISYMIDQRYGGAAGNMYFDAPVAAFQNAIWYFKYGTYSVDSSGFDATSWNLINNAIANGENYVPGTGDWFAGVVWPGNNAPGKYGKSPAGNNNTNYQMLIVGIDP